MNVMSNSDVLMESLSLCMRGSEDLRQTQKSMPVQEDQLLTQLRLLYGPGNEADAVNEELLVSAMEQHQQNADRSDENAAQMNRALKLLTEAMHMQEETMRVQTENHELSRLAEHLSTNGWDQEVTEARVRNTENPSFHAIDLSASDLNCLVHAFTATSTSTSTAPVLERRAHSVPGHRRSRMSRHQQRISRQATSTAVQLPRSCKDAAARAQSACLPTAALAA